MKARVTVTLEYELNPEHYNSKDPQEMALADQENFDDDPENLADFLFDNDYDVRVEVVS